MNVVIKNQWTVLPAAPGTCPECATEHSIELPHNIYSLYYQVRFYAVNGRAPTFEDAAAHCTSLTRELWLKAAKEVEGERAKETPTHD